MMMPGRSYSATTGYRYGFNGKENDNEVKGEGNQQDYGMRIYDPRLGRFLSVDPITKKYPELTPYQFASNRPIDGIDEDGLEWAYHDKDNKQVDINSTMTNADKLRITGVRWVGYDTDKDGNKIPKPGTVKTAYTFGAKGMTFHMTTSNQKPYDFWISYENISTGSTANDNKLGTLHSSLQDQMKSFILMSKYRFGIDLRVTDGFRSVEQQDILFAQGRTQAQIDAKKKELGITRTITANPKADVVTKAIGGYSNHNFGLAIDVVPFENGALNWNTQSWPVIGLIGESRGLEWGHRWKSIDDKPHFQNLQGKTLKELRALPTDNKGLPIIQ
jgi:RHS repeat-associated protein